MSLKLLKEIAKTDKADYVSVPKGMFIELIDKVDKLTEENKRLKAAQAEMVERQVPLPEDG